MTNLTLNKNPLRKIFDKKQKLNEVIDHIFSAEIDSETVLVNILLDGQIIPFEEGLEVSSQNIENFENIEFQAQTTIELAFEALDSCNEYIDLLSSKVLKLTTFFQESRFDEANSEFIELIDILDLYLQLFTKVYANIKRNYKEKCTFSEEIQQLEIHLLSVLKAMVPAKEKNDLIMLCDLLEYELIDNLTKWKIQIIPKLKAIKP